MLSCKRTGWITTLACGAWFLVTGPIAQAATINISLTAPVSTAAGNTLTVNGMLSNTTGSTVFLNAASINLAGLPPGNIDPAPFFTNAPLFLSGLAASANIGLFAITVPNPFASGIYAGTFTVLGGSSSTSQTNLGSANFTVQVNGPGGASVPEPASAALLVMGAAFLMAYGWRQTNPRR